jgi:hypothetical protein
MIPPIPDADNRLIKYRYDKTGNRGPLNRAVLVYGVAKVLGKYFEGDSDCKTDDGEGGEQPEHGMMGDHGGREVRSWYADE